MKNNPASLDKPVTRRELVEVIAPLATKKDLERFATKDDLKRFTTKKDLKKLEQKVLALDAEVSVLFRYMNQGFKEIKEILTAIQDELYQIRHQQELARQDHQNHTLRIEALEVNVFGQIQK